MSFKHILFLILALSVGLNAFSQTYPTIDPTATFTAYDGTQETTTAYQGTAPTVGAFEANAEYDSSEWTAFFEWRFSKQANGDSTYLNRYEENTEYTFTTAGTHYIILYATFTNTSGDKYELTSDAITVSISESQLEMPNAFSPNGDGINDVYKAKDGWKSLTEFHAYIFNRWGQLLYEWTDPDGGWDGTYKGKAVKDGVYFCLVKAKGADGKTITIKRDVNLLRGYTESSSYYE